MANYVKVYIFRPTWISGVDINRMHLVKLLEFGSIFRLLTCFRMSCDVS